MKKPNGRPKAEINLAEFEKLVMMGCTQEEIAAWFDICKNTLEKRLMSDKELRGLWDKASAKVRISLRRAQYQAAMKGNPTMLIWLGKIMLKQKDPTWHEHTGADGSPITVQHVKMTTEEIKGIAKRLEETY